MNESSHVTYWNGDRIQCARCFQSHHKRDAKHWLATRCTAVGNTTDKPVPIPFAYYGVGNRSAHYSHNLSIYRGLVFCNVCGHRAQYKMHNLYRECVKTTAGAASLKKIFKGELPQNLTAWPDETNDASQLRHACGEVSFHSSSSSKPSKNIFGCSKYLNRPDVPLGNAFQFSILEPACAASSSSSDAHVVELPLAQQLRELLDLSEAGEKVEWPKGFSLVTAKQWLDSSAQGAQCNALLHSVEVSTQLPSPPPPSASKTETLLDLLQLHEAGEPVTWPQGWSVHAARTLLSSLSGSL